MEISPPAPSSKIPVSPHPAKANTKDAVSEPVEILVIGAGVAGLTCAQQLQQQGHIVALLDKSRGLGGRLATRRLPAQDPEGDRYSPQQTHGDHGVCYLKPKHPDFRELLEQLAQNNILRIWTDQIHTLDSEGKIQPPEKSAPCYASANGITALAKFLARDLTVHRNHRAVGLKLIQSPTARSKVTHWQVTSDQGLMITAQQLVIAIPTPQAIALLNTLPNFSQLDPDCLRQLHSVQFSRCITAIATYPPAQQARAAQLPWQGITCPHHESLGWLGLDSSKQLNPQQPVVIVQSNSAFGKDHFESKDRPALGAELLNQAAQATGEAWLTEPSVLQVHRWGYAFALTPLARRSLPAKTPAPLYFAGDWCGGNRVENAYLSGLETADQIRRQSLIGQ